MVEPSQLQATLLQEINRKLDLVRYPFAPACSATSYSHAAARVCRRLALCTRGGVKPGQHTCRHSRRIQMMTVRSSVLKSSMTSVGVWTLKQKVSIANYDQAVPSKQSHHGVQPTARPTLATAADTKGPIVHARAGCMVPNFTWCNEFCRCTGRPRRISIL